MAKILTVVFIICLYELIGSQSSVLQKSSTGLDFVIRARLPSPRSSAVAVYDGDDSIFIIGGSKGSTFSNEIVQYVLSTNEVYVVANIPPASPYTGISHGAAFRNELTRNIHYIGGSYITLGSNYYSFEGWTISFSESGLPYKVESTLNLTRGFSEACTLWDAEQSIAYMITTSVWKYSAQNNTIEEFGRISGSDTPTCIWSEESRKGYLFGGNTLSPVYDDTIRQYDPSSGNTTVLTTRLSIPIFRANAAWDGQYSYIIGGWTRYENTTSGVTRFNPTTGSLETLNVNLTRNLASARSVWVPKYNRIYMFGGNVQNVGLIDEISSIDLDGFV